MKKTVALIIVIALFCFAGCSENVPEKLNENFAEMRNDLGEDLYGVVFLGGCEGGLDEIKEYVKTLEFFDDIDFIEEIDENHFFENEGYEIYLIIPNQKTTITIETLDFNDDYELVPVKTLGTVKDGKPVLIQGNMAEFVPNLNIVGTKAGETVEFSPSLSGMDGRLVEYEEKVTVWHMF